MNSRGERHLSPRRSWLNAVSQNSRPKGILRRRYPSTRPLLPGACRDRSRRDHFVERIAQRVQAIGRLDGLVVRAFNVEGVDRDAAFRAYARERDVEAVIGDRLREPIEKTDLVPRLDLDDRALHR